MEWSGEQDRALREVSRWLSESGSQVFRLFGYAGTGKTTLARHFAEGVGGNVLFAAYTGKAAHVLHQKGCAGATTIHSLIYRPKEKGKARLKELESQLAKLLVGLKEKYPEQEVSEHRRVRDIQKLLSEERKSISRPFFTLDPESPVKEAKLVIIDECSMVDGQLGQDLLSFGAKVLVLGDPAQLPPVMGGGFFTENHKPDVMLTEIHRQARDNPIIQLATLVREGRSLSLGSYGNSRVVEGKDIGPEDAMGASQILVGRNKTRRGSNRRMRRLNGIEKDLPVVGDKLVCLRNNHEKGLLNGAIWLVEHPGHQQEDLLYMSIRPEDGGEKLDVSAHVHYFLGKEDELPWYDRKTAEEFDYGYALTVHKAQGSQWPSVLLFDESWCFRADRNRWLYTGLTRASESVTVVRD